MTIVKPFSNLVDWFNNYSQTIHQSHGMVNGSVTMVEPFPHVVDW